MSNEEIIVQLEAIEKKIGDGGTLEQIKDDIKAIRYAVTMAPKLDSSQISNSLNRHQNKIDDLYNILDAHGLTFVCLQCGDRHISLNKKTIGTEEMCYRCFEFKKQRSDKKQAKF